VEKELTIVCDALDIAAVGVAIADLDPRITLRLQQE
jgi:hypothetical protein